MTDPITAAALGVIEGITEFLPVSSTGHLLIAEQWMPLPKDTDHDLFNVVIQAPAVMAVIPLFHKRFHQFVFNWRDRAVRDYLLKIIVAFAMTCVGGYFIDKWKPLPPTALPVAIALLIGGLLFVAVETILLRKNKEKAAPSADVSRVTWDIVIAVGIGQLIAAACPGASRSGCTILLALILGLGRPLATEFSFLVSIPTMLAASGWKILKTYHHPVGPAPQENWQMVIIACVVSAVVSFIAVKWLLRFVQSHTFIGFGWYRIAVGGALWAAYAEGLMKASS